MVVLGYIFFSVIPHASAPRYILASLMLLVALYPLCKRQLQKLTPDAVTVTLLSLFLIVVVSAAVSPYRAESLLILRKETPPFLLGYLLLTCQRLDSLERQQLARYSVVALIAGFVVKMSLAIWAGANNGWSFSIYEGAGQLPRYLDFFCCRYYLLLAVFIGAPVVLANEIWLSMAVSSSYVTHPFVCIYCWGKNNVYLRLRNAFVFVDSGRANGTSSL